MSLKIETIVNGPFQENCYLVYDDKNKQGAFIDPGDEPDKLISAAKIKEVKVEAIFNTHGHLDHAGAVADIADKLKIPFAMHPEDEFLLEGMPSQAAMFGLPPMRIPTLDRRLKAGEQIEIAGHKGEVLFTPGHTPGGVCFLFNDVVFVGDTLFAGSIGRTDLPGGSHKQLLSSIKSKLMVLDDSVRAFSGHGPVTTIGNERRNNPFLRL